MDAARQICFDYIVEHCKAEKADLEVVKESIETVPHIERFMSESGQGGVPLVTGVEEYYYLTARQKSTRAYILITYSITDDTVVPIKGFY